VARWESDEKQDVCKLIALITKIADVVKATPARKLEVRYRYGHGLELRHQVEGVAPVLPVGLAAQEADLGNWEDSTGGVRLKDGLNEKEADLDKKHDDASDGDEYDWDKKEDYTACSFESCNYCGCCSY